MTRRGDFRRLFREAFDGNAAWLEWDMERVYSDDNLLTLDSAATGKAASMLMISRCDMMYQGSLLPSGYISCVATARAERGQGLMHRLMVRALNICAGRGYAAVSLIPAESRLYYLYSDFGFETVYYVDEQRYTSLHAFARQRDFAEVEPEYAMFRRLEAMRPCSLRHSETDYSCVLDDVRLSGGFVVAVSDRAGGEAMAFVDNGVEARVIELLATDGYAAEAVLSVVRARVGEKAVSVIGMPCGRSASIRPRGMLRILNVDMLLDALAAAHPEVEQVIRVRDPILETNNAVFVVGKGSCRRAPDTMRRITLDVEIDVLAGILFSDSRTGEIFGIPSVRPFISLMLD